MEETYLIVPRESLSREALNGLVEEFILREGTDYGHGETDLAEKKHRVFTQLEKGVVKIVYSPLEDSTTLLKKDDLRKLGIEPGGGSK